MEALVAALACSFMMLPALGALAWYAVRGRPSRPNATAVAALRAEVAELRQSEPGPPRDEPAGGG